MLDFVFFLYFLIIDNSTVLKRKCIFFKLPISAITLYPRNTGKKNNIPT